MKFVKENGNEEEKSKVFFLADNDEEMRKFIKYIGEYYTCFDKIDDEIRNAIFEEMIADRISSILEKYICLQNPDIDMSEIKDISPFSEEEIFKSIVRQKFPKTAADEKSYTTTHTFQNLSSSRKRLQAKSLHDIIVQTRERRPFSSLS